MWSWPVWFAEHAEALGFEIRLRGVMAAGPRWLEIGSAVLPASGVRMWSFGGGVRLEALVFAGEGRGIRWFDFSKRVDSGGATGAVGDVSCQPGPGDIRRR